jgi:hypothetical protein
MKINQLFVKHVEKDLVTRLLCCYGLNGFNDKKIFSKHDLEKLNTVDKVNLLIEEIRSYYLPCKAKVYLENIDVKKSITVLKQVIRLHGYFLKSKEKTFNTRKIMFYELTPEIEKHQVNHIQYIHIDSVIDFK